MEMLFAHWRFELSRRLEQKESSPSHPVADATGNQEAYHGKGSGH